MRFLKLSLYLIIPLSFFTIWYFAVSFVDYEFNPDKMKSGVRFTIVLFGVPLSILGSYFASDGWYWVKEESGWKRTTKAK